jgi:hypothetical protein
MAAVALVALAVALPILLSQYRKPADSAESDNNRADYASRPQQGSLDVQSAPAAGYIAKSDSRPQDEAAGAANARTSYEEADQPGDKKKQATDEAADDSGSGPRSEPPQTQKVEAKSESQGQTEAERAATASQIAAQQPTAPPAPSASELARIDTKDTLRLPDQDKESAHTTIKPGSVGSEAARIEQREKTATITPQDTVAPPSESSGADPRARRSITQGAPGNSLRERRSSESARSRNTPERSVVGKRFRYLNGVWTDKDYHPDKEMPVVTILRDSDVYKDLLAKRSGLKPYFTNFAEGDRVIVVYKGTVYKLVPAGESK